MRGHYAKSIHLLYSQYLTGTDHEIRAGGNYKEITNYKIQISKKIQISNFKFENWLNNSC